MTETAQNKKALKLPKRCHWYDDDDMAVPCKAKPEMWIVTDEFEPGLFGYCLRHGYAGIPMTGEDIFVDEQVRHFREFLNNKNFHYRYEIRIKRTKRKK